MATYIDTTYIGNAIGAGVLTQLFTDEGSYVAAAVTQAIASASERTKSAGTAAGYSMSSTTTTDPLVQDATLGQFIALAYARKGLEVPAAYQHWLYLADGIMAGKIVLTGTPSANMTVGGVDWTSSDPSDDAGVASGDVRPPVFKTLRNDW